MDFQQKSQNICRKIRTSGEVLKYLQKFQNFCWKFGTSGEVLKIRQIFWISSRSLKTSGKIRTSAEVFNFRQKFQNFSRNSKFPAEWECTPKTNNPADNSPKNRRKARFSGERLTGRQRRKSCRGSICPAILLCSQ